jgi:hypothetical protein
MKFKEDLPAWNVLITKGTGGDRWDYTQIPYPHYIPDSAIQIEHQSRFWYSNNGDDLFFGYANAQPAFQPGPSDVTRLKNGWKVVEVHFSGDKFGGLVNSSLSETHVGTDNPSVKVHYFISSMFPIDTTFRYGLFIEIEGPKGVPYK